VVRAGPLPHQGCRAVLGAAPGSPTPLSRSAAPGLPMPGGLGMASDIPAAAAAPARPPARPPRTIMENRPAKRLASPQSHANQQARAGYGDRLLGVRLAGRAPTSQL
jgi:hypothetical protein